MSHDFSKETDQAKEFCRERLGDQSVSALDEPEVRRELRSRLQVGASPQDAALGAIFVVHAQKRQDSEAWNEFVAFILGLLLPSSRSRMSDEVRRLVDTVELVQSVLRTFLPNIHEIEFRNLGSFMSYLMQGVRWKLSDYRRKASRDRRVAEAFADPHQEVQRVDTEEASERAILDEFLELAWSKSEYLPERDQRILRMAFFEDKSIPEIGVEAELSTEAARVALKRAVKRLRQLFEAQVFR